VPVKPRRHLRRQHRITAEALEAYGARDYLRLHRALGLRPWQRSPLPLAVTALGVDQGDAPPDDGTMLAASWELAAELQRDLERVFHVKPSKGRA
jgi:hypothetical protein